MHYRQDWNSTISVVAHIYNALDTEVKLLIGVKICANQKDLVAVSLG